MNTMTATEFKHITGYTPIQDDVDRVTCLQAGDIGHQQCGFCEWHWKPRFMCGCVVKKVVGTNCGELVFGY